MSTPFYAIGKYACRITDQALGETSTGKPQFVLQFTVLGQVDPFDPSKYIPAAANYTRSYYKAITEKTIQYFVQDLQSLGYTHGSYRFLDPKTQGFHDFRGQEVDMYCTHEEDQNGDLREKWSVARGAQKLDVKPLESSKARALDNLFGKHLKGNTIGTPAVQPKPAAVAIASAVDEAPFPDDSDVPL